MAVTGNVRQKLNYSSRAWGDTCCRMVRRLDGGDKPEPRTLSIIQLNGKCGDTFVVVVVVVVRTYNFD